MEQYGKYGDESKKPGKMALVFGIIMVVIYLGMAYLLLFTPLFDTFSPIARYILAAVFLVYGIFRGYRQYKNL